MSHTVLNRLNESVTLIPIIFFLVPFIGVFTVDYYAGFHDINLLFFYACVVGMIFMGFGFYIRMMP